VTSGPTREAIDPVRYLSNHSSGKQGHAIAAALAAAGAEVTLVAGPVQLADPPGVKVTHVLSAREMLAACEAALPVDIAVCAAAVADWRPMLVAESKLKKGPDATPSLELTENPDILRTLATHPAARPRLVVGFAAETERLLEQARAKLARKGCDWIVVNDVSPSKGTFGSDSNEVTLIRQDGASEAWPSMGKQAVAERLVAAIAGELGHG
jgi:phosphopantothenoylcysteine decarboxylase/phosphopantothenate--cysteine ligase